MDRMEKVNHQIKKAISEIVLYEVKDPRLGFVTITEVQVSRDLQHAKVFFSVLGTELQAQEAQKGLESARGFIRHLVGQRVRMRYTPELNFLVDRSLERSLAIEATLGNIHDTEPVPIKIKEVSKPRKRRKPATAKNKKIR